MDDPIFDEEQRHLSEVYAALERLTRTLVAKIEATDKQAARDKRDMAEELSPNLSSDDESMETYAAFASINRIVEDYNRVHDADVETLNSLHALLEQPYFAKIVLQYQPDQPPKELYIGTAGMSDEAYRRLVVDWRSPVAEVYYDNQASGPVSYVADGRTIHADLQLRRQFDIERDRLRAYFDTTVAIQDSLLLASLSKRRSAQMQAITATIQREQNQVVRHADVPCLLVSGIAGSGKTSVLLQRIAYLYYQQRDQLSSEEVFLITPNPVFGHYIEGVLPDLGERNPKTLTWAQFAGTLLGGRGLGTMDVPLGRLAAIDEAAARCEFEAGDFGDVAIGGVRLVSAAQIARLSQRFGNVPAGPHRVTLIREKLLERLQSRLAQMAATEEAQLDLYALSPDEQVALFGETLDVQNESEEGERELTLRMLQARFAGAVRIIERDEWLRIDRIGMRLLGAKGLVPMEWLYLKMALTGLSNPAAKHVMVDEVQDYTAAQLAVLARYFRRAHFLLLGDPNQAIMAHTASAQETRAVFERACGSVEECRLMTSYRSTPQITNLFASLLDDEERGAASSIQREDAAPTICAFDDEAAWRAALVAAVQAAQESEGLGAVVAPWKHEARRLRDLLREEMGYGAPAMLEDDEALPDSGVVVITLKLAKGLEFDRVIVPDASAHVFPEGDDLARRRLYTTISRATREITILSRGPLTPLLGAHRPAAAKPQERP